jgi:hypothetical protein
MQDQFVWESDALEADQFEFPEEFEDSGEAEGESPFGEAEEMEHAAQLLELTDEAELDKFLGNLIRRAGSLVGRAVRSPLGRQLGGMLRNVAKQALPRAGAALATRFGAPPRLGAQLASTAGQLFGLELEGLSPQDQEYEVARRVVRLAGAATQQAVAAPSTIPPQEAARAAVVAAARRHAPGLLGGAAKPSTTGPGARARSGRWIRRGRNIIIVNC